MDLPIEAFKFSSYDVFPQILADTYKKQTQSTTN